MIVLLGFLMIASFTILIMTRRVSVMVALVLLPVIFGLAGGFGAGIGPMILNGVTQVVPIGLMLMFAIIFFSIMSDAGLFRPLVSGVLRLVGRDPLRIAFGTTAVSLIVSLSGDATSSALVIFAAFLPVYEGIGMNKLILATLLALSNSILNLLPWAGPLARVASALKLDPNAIFLPLVPTIGIATLAVLALTWLFGVQERRRLGYEPKATAVPADTAVHERRSPRERIFVWINLALTIAVLVAMVMRILPLPVVFMIGTCLALLVNFPSVKEQGQKLSSYAENAFTIISLILCSGALIGVMTDTGMVNEMANWLVRLVPGSWGKAFAMISGLMSVPLLFLMSNDAYYFGILPVIAQIGASYGVPALEIARSSMLGMPVHMFSPLLASLYLLSGMFKIDVGAFQRFALKWAVVLAAVMIGGALLTGAIR